MSEQKHPINEVLQTTMSRIREMVDTNTVVGQPIVTADGVTIIPVSKLSFGFATGGSDFGKTPNVEKNFGGGAGAGVNVTPVAFLIVKDGNVRTVQLADSSSTVDRALNMLPELVDKLSGMLGKKESADPAGETPQE